MGIFSSNLIPPKHEMIEKNVRRVGLEPPDVAKLYMIFINLDKENCGYILLTEYLERLLGIKRTLFTEAISDLIECKNIGVMTFPEMVEMTCTFSTFETYDLLKFVYFCMDRDKIGDVDIKECESFISLMWDNEAGSNLDQALVYLNSLDGGDGRVNYENLVSVHKKYPSTFYPVFRIQAQIIATSFGEFWWEARKVDLIEALERKRRLEELKSKKAAEDLAKEMERQTELMVAQKMGLKYYYWPWGREKVRKQIAKIAAINKQLEDLEAAEAKAEKDRISKLKMGAR